MNGVLHCRVRYSQLLGLHEQVGRALGPLSCSVPFQLSSCVLLDSHVDKGCLASSLLPLLGCWGSARVGGQGSPLLSEPLAETLFLSQLRKEYGANVVPAFPPKKIFTLTPAEVEQRREQLEKYMQAGKLGLPWLGCAGHGPWLPLCTAPLTEAHPAAPGVAFDGCVPWMPAAVPAPALPWQSGDVQGGSLVAPAYSLRAK